MTPGIAAFTLGIRYIRLTLRREAINTCVAPQKLCCVDQVNHTVRLLFTSQYSLHLKSQKPEDLELKFRKF